MENNRSKNMLFIKELFIIGLLLIPIFYLLTIWDSLPSEVPIHWNLAGEVDRYGSKSSLWGLALLINIPIYLLMLFLPKFAAKKESIQQMGKKYYRLRFALQLFMSALALIIMLSASGNSPFAIEKLLGYSFILFMLLFGNYMGSIRQNHFMGIRTPWTLENAEVWKKTHQLGGRLWVGSAFIGLIFLLFLPKHWIIMSITGLMVVPMLMAAVYSFVLFKQLTAEN